MQRPVTNNQTASLNKHNKENSSHSPRANKDEEETKGVDDFRGVKNKPKIIPNKLPSAFDHPKIKYKNKQSDHYSKHPKELVRNEESRKSKQNTLEPLPIPIDRQNKMNKVLKDGNKAIEQNPKYDSLAKSHSNGFGMYKSKGGDVQINTISPSNVTLQQMVSLVLIKSTSKSGAIKKTLHVPTFSIY